MDRFIVIKHNKAFDNFVKTYDIKHYYDIDIFAEKIDKLPLKNWAYIVSATDYEKFKQECIKYNVVSFTFVIVEDSSKFMFRDMSILKLIEIKQDKENKILTVYGTHDMIVVNRICAKDMDYIAKALYDIVTTFIPHSDIVLSLTMSAFARKRNVVITNEDIEFLGNGGINMVFDISKYEPNSIIRIPGNRRSFVASNYELIKNYGENLFVNIREIFSEGELNYLICEKLKPIENIYAKDFNEIVEKLITFVKRNPGYQYTDLKYDNVMMNDKNEMVVSDMDIKFVNDSLLYKIAQNTTDPIPYNEIVKVNCNFDLAFQVFKRHNIKLTSTNVSIFLLNLIREIGIRQHVLYTKELENKVLKRCNF